MTISLPVGVMTADEKPESSHEYNFFLDRQLQNKLLEFDEQDIDSRYFQNVKLEGKAYRAQVRSEEVTGWVFDTKTNFRKPEKESNKQQKEFIQPWKDYKAKQQKDDSFMFRHYGDLKKYIQQYREEHSNVFGFRPPGVPMKSDAPIGEIRKYLNHHSAPTPSAGATHHNQTSAHNHTSSQTQVSTVCTQCTNSNGNQQLITASMYYTNRKDSSVSLPNGASVSNSRNNHNSHSHGHHCSKHNSHINPDHAYKYKLAPEAAWRSDSVQSSCVDSDRNDGVRTPRINSAKGDRGKSPTKVMVPAGASNGPPKGHPLQSVTVAWRLPSQAKQSGDHAQTSGSSRTLDTLTCVAAEKQGYGHEYPMSPHMSFSPDNMDSKSDISLSRLSTTCLGAEMKVRLSEKLEPSCTFHLFPAEAVIDAPPIILNTGKPLIWNPATSAPGQRRDSQRETIISSPFKGYVRVIDPNGDYKSSKMKLILNKEAGKVDFPALKAKNGMLVASDINLGEQAKFKSETVPSKSQDEHFISERKSSSASYEKTSKLFCTKNLRSRFAGYIKGKKTRASSLRKSESAAVNRNAYSARAVRPERSEVSESVQGDAVNSGLNYWAEEPEEFQKKALEENVDISEIQSNESMKRVAEYILRESSRGGNSVTPLEVGADSPTPRNGMWFDSAGRAYVSLAARYDPLKK